MLQLGKVKVCPGFWLLLGGTLLVGALDVLGFVAVAALLHELGHFAALRLVGARVEELRLTAFGAEIRADTRYLPYGRDILCTLAGPAANLAAAFLFARIVGDELMAGANLLEGAFNLLPLPGLDGARAQQLLLSCFLGPVRGERIARAMQLGCTLLLAAAALWLVVRQHAGGFLLAAMGGVFVSIWREWTSK